MTNRMGLSRALCLALIALAACAKSDEKKPAAAADEEPPLKVVHDPSGGATVELNDDSLVALKIETAALAKIDVVDEVELVGRVIADPSKTFTLRAPIAGTLRANAWPAVGKSIEPSATFASIEPRLSAAERVDLAARRTEADGDRAGAEAELEGARLAATRAKELNADAKSVSDKALQEAESRVKTLEAKLSAAEQRIALFDGALAGRGGAATLPVALERGGEVTALFAQPGEALEAGAPIVALSDFSAPLIELVVPLGVAVAPTTARVASSHRADHFVAATFESRAVEQESAARGEVLRFRIGALDGNDTSDALAFRPGEPVSAWVARGGAASSGVAIPRSAVVRIAGKTWIWIVKEESEFVRTEIALGAATESGWISNDAALAGEMVVVTGAASLLSCEMLGAQSTAGGDEE